MINLINLWLYKLVTWIMGEAYAQEVYGPPEYFEKLPAPLYGPAPTVNDFWSINNLWYLVGYIVGGILLLVALFFVWLKFFRKKNVKKTD